MKKIFVVLFFITSSIYSVYGQSINEIFLELSSHGGISKEERQLMIDNYIQNKRGREYGIGESKHHLTTYEPNSGYLSYSGAYEGSSSITFWNLTNGAKLIATKSSSCGGACDCDISFIYKGSLYMTRLSINNVLPTITFADFMDVEQMKKDGIDIEREMNLFYGKDLMYSLPLSGKNIVVSSQYHELDMSDNLKKYDLGWKLELIWNDGTFLKKKKTGL